MHMVGDKISTIFGSIAPDPTLGRGSAAVLRT